MYLEEYTKAVTSKEYQESTQKSQLIRPTKLKASDFFMKRSCAGSFDASCRYKEVTDQNVHNFVSQRKTTQEKKFEKDANSIIDSIESNDKKGDLIEIDSQGDECSLSDPISTQDLFATQKDDPKGTNSYYNIFNKGTPSTFDKPVKKIPDNPFKRPKLFEPSNDVNMETDSLYRDKLIKKPTNPWKEERTQSKSIVAAPDAPNQFDLKSSKYFAGKKENFTAIKNPFEKKVDEQHSASSKVDKDEVRKSDVKQLLSNPFSSFRTGNQELEWQKNLQKKPPPKGLSKKRVVTVDENVSNNDVEPLRQKFHCPSFPKAGNNKSNGYQNSDLPDELKGFAEGILERIQREIVVDSRSVSWDDIIGLDGAKKVIKESVILAIKRPDLFTGLRESTRAIMLFGPPGTGKTLIGKCIASSCNATFLSVSASSLTSKWIGESESLVRALFTYAKYKQPCVIFFDEIDSLLEKRSEQGNETFNRIKTEFLVQLDGANALKAEDQVLLIGATNRPDVIDEAILRRFTKRILVPLPVKQARINMFRHLLSKHNHTLTDSQVEKLAEHCEKYSGSDIAQVCKEAAMMSLRRMDEKRLEAMHADDVS